MTQSRLEKKEEKKGSLRKVLKAFLVLCVISLLTFGGFAGYLAWKLSNVTADEQPLQRGDKSERRTEAVNPSKDNFSVLLLGDDARPGEKGARTDAMLVATFNKDKNSIILTSIPRDMRVELIGRGTLDKINHAHAYGGLDMSIDTVEHFLDIPIDYYGWVNFEGLIEVVDALGGIEVDVQLDFEEKKYEQ